MQVSCGSCVLPESPGGCCEFKVAGLIGHWSDITGLFLDLCVFWALFRSYVLTIVKVLLNLHCTKWGRGTGWSLFMHHTHSKQNPGQIYKGYYHSSVSITNSLTIGLVTGNHLKPFRSGSSESRELHGPMVDSKSSSLFTGNLWLKGKKLTREAATEQCCYLGMTQQFYKSFSWWQRECHQDKYGECSPYLSLGHHLYQSCTNHGPGVPTNLSTQWAKLSVLLIHHAMSSLLYQPRLLDALPCETLERWCNCPKYPCLLKREDVSVVNHL